MLYEGFLKKPLTNHSMNRRTINYVRWPACSQSTLDGHCFFCERPTAECSLKSQRGVSPPFGKSNRRDPKGELQKYETSNCVRADEHFSCRGVVSPSRAIITRMYICTVCSTLGLLILKLSGCFKIKTYL